MTELTNGIRGKVVTPTGVIDDGVVAWDHDRFTFVGVASDEHFAIPRTDGYILPGLVDEHVHGGGGASFPDATTLDEVAQAANEHIKHGTTRIMATLTTMKLEDMLASASLLADACDAGIIDGINIEGPFLSRDRAGAQNAAFLHTGDVDVANQLIDAARGYAWSMTIAPEVDGMADVIKLLAARDITPAFGHTQAGAALTREFISLANSEFAQARAARGSEISSPRNVPVATHLFNAMREIMHRAPGPVPEFLAAAHDGAATVELIADGTHLDPEIVRTVVSLLGPDRVSLVTDATAAAGMADGTYTLGGLLVHVTDGVARLRGGNLAGGTSHLIDTVRTTWHSGVDLVTAVTMASQTPARVTRRDDVGALRAGNLADLVVTDTDLNPLRVVRGGVEIDVDGRPNASAAEPA